MCAQLLGVFHWAHWDLHLSKHASDCTINIHYFHRPITLCKPGHKNSKFKYKGDHRTEISKWLKLVSPTMHYKGWQQASRIISRDMMEESILVLNIVVIRTLSLNQIPPYCSLKWNYWVATPFYSNFHPSSKNMISILKVAGNICIH